MTHPYSEEKQSTKDKNDFGTSPSQYSDIVKYEVSSIFPTGTSGIGAKRGPVEDK